MAIARNRHQAPMQNLPCMFLLLLLLHSAAVRENCTGHSVAWSDYTESLVEDSDELAGGFPTWDSTLQWTIDHSYTAELKEKAEYTEKLPPKEISRKQSPIKEIMEGKKMPDVELMKIIVADLSNSSYPFEKRLWAQYRLLGLVELTDNALDRSYTAKSKEKAEYTEKLSPKETSRKQSPIKEIIKREKMPDVELMKIIVADLSNSSYPFEKRLWALSRLLELVELIDNALVMDKLGGLVAVVKELKDTESEIRATSAWVLGKASRNNVRVQNQILGYGALTRLMKMVRSSDTEEAVKAFYAISSLIRNNKRGQALFYLKGGDSLLQDMLTNSGIDTRLQEKVLMVVKSLLHVASTKALDLLEFFSLEQALETVRVQLEELSSDEDLAGFARNVEILFWQLGLRNGTLMQ